MVACAPFDGRIIKAESTCRGGNLGCVSGDYIQFVLSSHVTCGLTICFACAGLMGGHSGLNINEDRGNAVRFVAQVTNAVLKAAPNARLARITGGDKRNAIAREASADMVVCTDLLPSTLPMLHGRCLRSEHALGGEISDSLKLEGFAVCCLLVALYSSCKHSGQLKKASHICV